MKRFWFLILLFCTMLARAGQRAATAPPKAAAQKEFLHPGLTGSETAATLATPAGIVSRPHCKKTVAFTPGSTTFLQRPSFYSPQVKPVPGTAFSKSYLLHIYPSLHFW